MPIQTRCPSCSAAVPTNAAWCSLCHADLRPRQDHTVPEREPTVGGQTDLEPPLRTVPSGRHAAGAPAAPERATAGGGRHAAGRRSSSRPVRRAAEKPAVEAVLEGIEIPVDAQLTPEQVDELADRMLRRLAVTEKTAPVLDPEDLPGGKWGFAAGLMAVIVVALIAVGTVVGFLMSR